MACAANLLLFIACSISDRVDVIYPIIYDILLGIAFLYYWPTLLALVSRAAPAGLKATLMGRVFLTLFHLEHPDRPDRRILRAHDAGSILDDARGDCGVWWVACDGAQQAPESCAGALKRERVVMRASRIPDPPRSPSDPVVHLHLKQIHRLIP
ncbi:MAG: hypothetical protein ABI884_13415, partial [Gemmatimonadota bacterium]